MYEGKIFYLLYKIENDKIKLFALKKILIYGYKKSSIKLLSTLNAVYFATKIVEKYSKVFVFLVSDIRKTNKSLSQV